MLIKYEKIKKEVVKIFEGLGLSSSDSRIATETLLRSDFTGVNSHGINRLENYIYKIKEGYINIYPEIKQINSSKLLKKLDGDNGLGLVVGPKALDLCIEAANDYGISCVTVNNSNHFGVGNYYGNKIAENDMIGIVITNSTPSMAPYGGVEKLLGTNPIIITIPTNDKDNPIILDMATSEVAFGTIEQFARDNIEIKGDLIMDLEGNITNDPNILLSGLGMLMPMSRHKGYGLSLIVDLLCYALAGANPGKDLVSLRAKGDELKPEGVGHIMIAIKIEEFDDVSNFKNKVDDYKKMIKDSKKKKGISEIYMPGEVESNKLRINMEQGIKINSNTYEYIKEIAEELGFEAFK